MHAVIELSGKGCLKVEGVIDTSCVMPLLQQGLICLKSMSETSITIDFSLADVKNSTGVALMLLWLKAARASKKIIAYQGLSPSLLRIIEVSNLTCILGGSS